MNIQFPLPSNGRKYGKVADFSGLEMRHFEHLSTFSQGDLPESTRFSAVIEALSDTMKIDDLPDLFGLYSIDFDALIVHARCMERPEAREFMYAWSCSRCKAAGKENYSHNATLNLGKIPITNVDDVEFHLGEYTFDFITVGGWLEVWDYLHANMWDIFEHLDGAERLQAEAKCLEKTTVARLAAQVKLALPVSFGERLNLMEKLPLRYRPDVIKMLANMDNNYGLRRYDSPKCSNCGKVVRIQIPFHEIVTFF